MPYFDKAMIKFNGGVYHEIRVGDKLDLLFFQRNFSEPVISTSATNLLIKPKYCGCNLPHISGEGYWVCNRLDHNDGIHIATTCGLANNIVKHIYVQEEAIPSELISTQEQAETALRNIRNILYELSNEAPQ